MSKAILIVDDDETLLELLSGDMQKVGYRTLTAKTGEQALNLAANDILDLVVLDVMMPGMDGWEVCTRLRETSSTAIIMLTAKGEEFDKLRGFHLGVDDYVTKPFSFPELMARIGAVLTRLNRGEETSRLVQSGDIIVNLDQHTVVVNGRLIDLTPTEYRLLEALASHANRIVPTERLLEDVWGPKYSGDVESVKHYIWSLRQKLETDPGNPRHILTERGFGYRFE